MQKYAVIVAGGSGTRMGGGLPKQFRSLKGRPVVWWAMKAFLNEDPLTNIRLVLPQDFIVFWLDYFKSLPIEDQFAHQVIPGGASRSESVSNGLRFGIVPDSLVAIHDGARPLVTPEIIRKGWITAEKYGAAIPAVGVTDSLRKLSGKESEAVDRSEYVAVQTPQVFKTDLLKEAYRKAEGREFSDDASLFEAAGGKVTLFEGSPYNIKITNPKDLEIANCLMANG